VGGINRERREHREDPRLELAGELCLLVLVEVFPVGELDASLLEAGRDFLGERARLAGDELLDPRPDRAELLDLVQAVRRIRAYAGCELLLEAGNAHLEELVEIRTEDREELGSFEQGQRRVFGERQHASVEIEPGQLAIEVARIVESGESDRVRERHGAMVMAGSSPAQRRPRKPGG
jgi:hypothetical protein